MSGVAEYRPSLRGIGRLVGAAALLSLSVAVSPAVGAADLNLTAEPVQLQQSAPDVARLGALVWRGGLALTAREDGFGGLSDLQLTGGDGLVAVGDKGRWVAARRVYDSDGHLTGLADARLAPYRGPDGRPVADSRLQDAESLTRRPDGTWLVGFEQRHRVWAYPDGLAGAAAPLPVPEALTRGAANRGAEALLHLADGRLLLVSENRGSDGRFAGWLRRDGRWRALEVAPPAGYRPTGLAQLPGPDGRGGDLLLVTRRFTWLGGFQAKLLRLPLAALQPGTRLEGEVLAAFHRPWIVDNFEGVAAYRRANGETRVLLVSDDNFNVLQRTLLLEFALIR
jgi:hypothetical protein